MATLTIGRTVPLAERIMPCWRRYSRRDHAFLRRDGADGGEKSRKKTAAGARSAARNCYKRKHPTQHDMVAGGSIKVFSRVKADGSRHSAIKRRDNAINPCPIHVFAISPSSMVVFSICGLCRIACTVVSYFLEHWFSTFLCWRSISIIGIRPASHV